jgi:hypothetical protein
MAVIDARHKFPEGGPIDDVVFTKNEAIDYGRAFDEFRDRVIRWFPEALAPDTNIDFSDGAGAIRANGKFYAFRFADCIQKSLDTAIDQLVKKRTQIAGDAANRFAIYIICSLGNGTGGGTFFDIATMVKDLLSFRANVVKCFGVFIPGSVTRQGNPGRLNHRVAASGYASLLELQYEFNRQLPRESFRPIQHYSFEAWDGKDYIEYLAGRGQENLDLSSPIDVALILDRRDRNGLESSYPTLLNLAAEGVAQLVEGADADSRLVDALVQLPAGRRFGSFGAVRLSVPARRLLEFTSCRQALNSLAAGYDERPSFLGELLADETPDGRMVLRAKEAGYKKSADFFIEHILKIKETGEGGAADYNQLFDLFQGREEELLKQFGGISAGIEELSDAKEIVDKGEAIQRFVEKNTKDLKNTFVGRLCNGPDSLWEKTPGDPEKPLDAGVKWHIDQRVKRFVVAGAFGPLVRWLRVLRDHIENNYKSIEHERRQWLSGKPKEKDQLEGELKKIRREADSAWAFFRRGRLKEHFESFHQDGRNHFRYLLANAKIEAVERFYNLVLSHLEKLEGAAVRARSRFIEPRMRDYLEERLRLVTRELDVNLRQESTTEGLKAELFIGGDQAMREMLIEDVDKGQDTSRQAILSAMAEQNLELFIDGLGSDIADFSAIQLKEAPETDINALYDDYRNMLQKTAENRIEPFLQKRCRIDTLLEEEAKHQLQIYYEESVQAGDAVDPRKKQEIIQRIKDLADPVILEYIQGLDWKRDYKKAMEKAIDYFIAGKLFKVIAFATPQWSVVFQEKEHRELIRITFVTFNPRASRVSKAVEQMTTGLNLFGAGVQVKAQADEFVDARRIDIVQVELGGRLKSLAMDQELRPYSNAMLDMPGFSPHLTQQLHDVGLRFLDESGAKPAEGAIFLALAELYDLVASEAGNYRLTKGLEARHSEGKLLHRNFPADYKIGRGLAAVVNSLDSTEAEAVDLRTALRRTLWEELEKDAYGDGGERMPLTWRGVARRLNEHAGRLRGRANEVGDPEVAEILKKQAHGIEEQAAEIDRLQGKGKSSLFA